MVEEIPRISVIVITYNHEKMIRRALESVLVQKEYVYEIIVSDDCSSDNNWEVIENYKNQYPKLIKAYRNEENLGIFKHLEKTWSYPSGDLIISLAGDDIICNGLFKVGIDFIKNNKIDYTQGAFCIYTDSKIVYPNGKEKIRSNSMVAKGFNPVSLKIRGLLGSSRGVFKSKKIYQRYRSPNLNIGIYTDGLYDIQVQLNAEKNYYLPFIGGVYYAGIGIASRTSKEDHSQSFLKLNNYFLENIQLDKKDRSFLKQQKYYTSFKQRPSIKKILLTTYYMILSQRISYGVNITGNVKLILKMIYKLLFSKNK